MPRGRLEWLAFAACLVGVAALVLGLDVRPHLRRSSASTAATTAASPPAPAATTGAVEQARTAPPAQPKPAQRKPARRARVPTARASTTAATAPKLVLAAARGSCWLEVRVGSRTGAALYSGLLQQGGRLRFAKPRLWIRFGAAANVDASLNGKPITSLPEGTVEVLVTAGGVAQAH